MSSFAYPDLAATLPPDMVAPEAVMPPPAVASQDFLHTLGQMLADKDKNKQPQAERTQSSNPYSANNSSNPYAIEGGSPFAALQGHMQAETQSAANPVATNK